MTSRPPKPAPPRSSATPLSLSRFLTLWHQRTGSRGDQPPPRKLFSTPRVPPISRKISSQSSPKRD
jgi:hypothetical protein